MEGGFSQLGTRGWAPPPRPSKRAASIRLTRRRILLQDRNRRGTPETWVPPCASAGGQFVHGRVRLLAPARVTATAPTRTANPAASARFSPSPRRHARAAVKASPAPVVSTASTRGLGTRWYAPETSAVSAPSAPSVITTDRGPGVRSPRAQSSGVSPASSSPRITLASCSLTTRGLQAANSSAGSGIGGDGFSTKRDSGASIRTAFVTDSRGISSCADTTFAAAIKGADARMSSGVRRLLTPGETTMLLSPEGSTVISATPVGAPQTSTPAVVDPGLAL